MLHAVVCGALKKGHILEVGLKNRILEGILEGIRMRVDPKAGGVKKVSECGRPWQNLEFSKNY